MSQLKQVRLCNTRMAAAQYNLPCVKITKCTSDILLEQRVKRPTKKFEALSSCYDGSCALKVEQHI